MTPARKDPRTLAAFLRDFATSRRAMRSNDEIILSIYPRLTPDGSERLDLENEDLITAADLLEKLVVESENMRSRLGLAFPGIVLRRETPWERRPETAAHVARMLPDDEPET